MRYAPGLVGTLAEAAKAWLIAAIQVEAVCA